MTSKRTTALNIKRGNIIREIVSLCLEIDGRLLESHSLQKLQLIKSKLDEVIKIVKDEKNEKDAQD